MADVDTEYLIALVQERPVLWDKYMDVYKDRKATKNAWHEICVELHDDFEALDDKEKNDFGKKVISRWSNVRDSFSKYKKKDKGSKKNGPAAKRHKKYVYYNQLRFLDKLFDARETSDSLEPSNEHEKEEKYAEPQLQVSSEVPKPVVKNSTSTPKRRKRKRPNEVELRLSEAEKLCSKTAFLQSLVPHLQNFNDQDFLQFQMGVLRVIENINEHKKEMYPYPLLQSPNFRSQRQFPTQSQSYLDYSSTATQSHSRNFFTAPNQSPHFLSLPFMPYNQALLKQEMQTRGSDLEANKQPPYFHDSPESGPNTPSLHSSESSIADSIDFGTSD